MMTTIVVVMVVHHVMMVMGLGMVLDQTQVVQSGVVVAIPMQLSNFHQQILSVANRKVFAGEQVLLGEEQQRLAIDMFPLDPRRETRSPNTSRKPL